MFILFLKIWVYFQAFKRKERSGKHEKNLKLKVSVSEKKKSAQVPIPKLDFGFGRTLLEQPIMYKICPKYI